MSIIKFSKYFDNSLSNIIVSIILAVIFGKFFYIDALTYPIQVINTIFVNLISIFSLPMIIISIAKSSISIGISENRSKIIKIFMLIIMGSLFLSSILSTIISYKIYTNYENSLDDQNIEIFQESKTEIPNKTDSPILTIFFPPNLFEALSNSNITGSILFFFLLGISLGKNLKNQSDILLTHLSIIINSIIDVIKKITSRMPIFIFLFLLKSIQNINKDILYKLVLYLSSFIISLTLMLIILTITAIIFYKTSYSILLKAMAKSFCISFSTSSSSIAFCNNNNFLKHIESKHNIKSCFILPFVSSTAMIATSIELCCALMFLISLTPTLDFTFKSIYTVILISSIFVIGTPGIPYGGLPPLILGIQYLGIPNSSLYFIMILDRFVDMFKSSFNALYHLTISTIISKINNEKQKL